MRALLGEKNVLIPLLKLGFLVLLAVAGCTLALELPSPTLARPQSSEETGRKRAPAAVNAGALFKGRGLAVLNCPYRQDCLDCLAGLHNPSGRYSYHDHDQGVRTPP